MARLRQRVTSEIPEAQIAIFGAPPVSGLGRAGGFRVMIEDRGGNGPKVLERETLNMISKGNQQPGLTGLFTVYATNSPQLFLDVDRTACMARGLDLNSVFGTLQATMGAQYVNDFNLFGRTWQVNVQSEQQLRSKVEDVGHIKVRNRNGDMIPLGAVVKVVPSAGPLVITRHNMYPAAPINGNVAPGYSTGEAYSMFTALANQELQGSMAFEWSELAFIEQKSASSALKIFGLSVIFVFLALAALYESWMLPLAVILVVPVCVVGSLVAVDVANQDVNIFTQVGFVVLVGLACKNAILIVEFAKLSRERGKSRRQAVLDACYLRFRPILMTSVAFILGVLPLLISTGAGAEMRKALGTAVFGGMIGVTLFGIVLTPVFFVIVDWFSELSFRNRYTRSLAIALTALVSLDFARYTARWIGGRFKKVKLNPRNPK
jgi:multidrug efflux pump